MPRILTICSTVLMMATAGPVTASPPPSLEAVPDATREPGTSWPPRVTEWLATMRAVASTGDARAVPPLLKAVGDADQSFGNLVLYELGQMGSAAGSAVGELRRMRAATTDSMRTQELDRTIKAILKAQLRHPLRQPYFHSIS